MTEPEAKSFRPTVEDYQSQGLMATYSKRVRFRYVGKGESMPVDFAQFTSVDPTTDQNLRRVGRTQIATEGQPND